jgi:ABC-type antimicrobial peptide transport system permease subunit
MIILESIVYGIVGGPIGVFIGWLTILYFGQNGLDLSTYAQGMEAFGYDPIVYFQVNPIYYLIYTIMIVLATIIGAIYPSMMATSLNPISAIRSV